MTLSADFLLIHFPVYAQTTTKSVCSLAHNIAIDYPADSWTVQNM